MKSPEELVKEMKEIYGSPKYDVWRVELGEDEICDSYEYINCSNRHHNEYACEDCFKVCGESDDDYSIH